MIVLQVALINSILKAKAKSAVAELGISEVLACQETGQHSVSIGTKTHIYDNRASSIKISPSLVARKTWQQRVEVNFEALITQTRKATTGFNQAPVSASFEQGIQTAIKQAYTRSEGTERTYEQTLNFDVPARVKLTVLLKWSQIWQDGFVTLALTNGQTANVPYSVALEVSYDIETSTSH